MEFGRRYQKEVNGRMTKGGRLDINGDGRKYHCKSCDYKYIKEKHEKDIKTWPAINPKTCIDYIWIKGKDVKICSANIFGNALNTDHKGVKCCLDIR